MADKEATVFIVDVGKSMGKKHHGRKETDLDWSLHYVWDKITTTVATGRKTALIGVVGLRTNDTENELADDEGYQNISVLQPLKQTLMPDIRALREALRPSRTDDGDAVSAIVVAIQMIAAQCKKLKYIKRIFLITNGIGIIDTNEKELKQIAEKIKADNIELTVLGTDFDDADFGFKEENKDPTKEHNEQTLRTLVANCDGVYGTMAEAIGQLGIPRVKAVRPVTSYKGLLTLGDPEKFDSAMCIDVERYPKVMVARPPTASKYVIRGDMAPGESTQSSATLVNGQDGQMEVEDGLAAVKQARAYQVDDPDVPGGKRDVPMEELAKGYEYGRTAVPLSDSDMNVVKLETQASLDIVGFVDSRQYEQYMNMSKSNIIIANKVNEKAKLAISSLVHALYELESYAVARYVKKNGEEPVLLLLAPYIEAGYECLVDVELPFAEDYRQYAFPPLDKVVTVAGKNLIQHRYLPSDDLMKAMSQYVDAMDISSFGKDEDGQDAEYARMEDTYSPVLNRIQQVLRWRAVHPTEPVPEPYDILVKYSQPPEELVQNAQPALNAVMKAGDVKKVPPKQKGRKRARDVDKPLSGLDIDELLGREKRTKISAENAIPEFKQFLATTEDVGAIKDVTEQMAGIVHNYIRHSVGDSGYGRAIEAIRVLREELNDLEEPGLFNDFMKDLKQRLLGGKLGGDRTELWWRIRANRLGLLDKRMTNGLSDVSEEEAKAFLSAK